MAHQADVVSAALALAAAATENADLVATVQQMRPSQQMDYAAMVSENAQLRLERENTRLRHEAQLQALAVTVAAERDVARAPVPGHSGLQGSPGLLHPPTAPAADGAPPVASVRDHEAHHEPACLEQPACGYGRQRFG
jgi:hypothetical protein